MFIDRWQLFTLSSRVQLSSAELSWVEVCRYKRALTLLVVKQDDPKFSTRSSYDKCFISFISLVALLWTLSIKLISLLRYGLHNWQQCSWCGLTRLLYSGMTVSFDLSWNFLVIRPSILFAFFTASMHCLSHFISTLTVTPKSNADVSPSVRMKKSYIPTCKLVLLLYFVHVNCCCCYTSYV